MADLVRQFVNVPSYALQEVANVGLAGFVGPKVVGWIKEDRHGWTVCHMPAFSATVRTADEAARFLADRINKAG